MDFVVASLDTAYTTKSENDFSALTIWGVFGGSNAAYATRWSTPSGRLMSQEDQTAAFDQSAAIRALTDVPGGDTPRCVLMHAWAERLELHDLVQKIADTCRKMKVDRLLIENKASGYSVAQEIRRLFGHENWGVFLLDPKGTDKLARLYSVQHLFAEGLVYAPDKGWADMVITQTSVFPKGKHDDLVDTVSQALRHIRDIGLLTRPPEWAAEIADNMRANGHGPNAPPAIYPV
jgi:predicted phage terminase large subunit-like protein